MKAAPSGICSAIAIAFTAAPALAQANGVGSPFELAYWQAVADSSDAAQYDAYLAQYPQGTFAAIARLRVAALRGQSAPPSVAAPVPVVAAKPAPLPVPAPILPVSDGRADLVARVSALEPGGAAHAATTTLPPTPILAAVPPVPIPPSFCSAIERNAYHDDVYRPTRSVAQDNNRAAIAHLRALQQLYDSYAPTRDFDRMNVVADAAQAFQPLADNTYQVTVGYDAVFDRLMAVPIINCADEP